VSFASRAFRDLKPGSATVAKVSCPVRSGGCTVFRAGAAWWGVSRSRSLSVRSRRIIPAGRKARVRVELPRGLAKALRRRSNHGRLAVTVGVKTGKNRITLTRRLLAVG
jgi:hypothetical protein